MAGNSLASILETMKQGDIMNRWGAIVAFDHVRLNNVLRQQWLEAYDGYNYLPVFSGKVDLTPTGSEWCVLQNVHLGKPEISFEPSTLQNSTVLLTIALLAGSFTVFEQNTGMLYSFDIHEEQGHTLKIKLDLSMVVGIVDQMGRVTLQLGDGIDFSCDLPGPAASQKKVGELFKESFKKLPLERRILELGTLNLQGGSSLSPSNFMILTQREPGAEQPGAMNSKNGAVLVMVQLRGDELGGDIPSEERIPYLIANDSVNGVPRYSAAMVLAQRYIPYSDDDKLALIRSVLFPKRRNVFVEESRHTPHDMYIAGNVEPTTSSVTIEPSTHSVKAGGAPITYKAYRNGALLNGVEWTVRSLNTINSVGTIDAKTGVYAPVSAAQIGQQSVRNIVTATWTEPAEGERPAQDHRVSALLLVSSRPMTISPGCVPRPVGGESVDFVATALSSSTLTWKQPAYGTLVANGNSARYTPPAEYPPEHVTVQPIEVSDQTGETVAGYVVLSNFKSTMTIDPPFVSDIARSGTVQLTEESGAPDELERHWEVLGNAGGTVVDGKYTAPANGEDEFVVVKCDIRLNDGFLLRTGYSIIKLQNFNQEDSWDKIIDFKLESVRSEKLYDNGYQQATLRCVIQTNGRPLTGDEEATVKLHYVNSRQAVADVAPLQDGIPYDPARKLLWAQSTTSNGFFPFPGNFQNDVDSSPSAELPNRFLRHLVTRDKDPVEFYASVMSPYGLQFDSDVTPGHEDGRITFVPVPSPKTSPSNFRFERRRISGGGTGDTGDTENEEDFDLYIKTVDYFGLYATVENRALTFMFMEFMKPAPGGRSPVSIVAWESPFENESMFSFTGLAYNSPKKNDDRELMQFDSIIENNPLLKPTLDHKVHGGVAEGHLLISLFRRTNVRQDDWRGVPGNKDLHPLSKEAGVNTSLKLILTDNEGHRHALAITFRAGNRNRFTITPLPELFNKV
ncbi:hypothetical protein [Pseudomonas sp. SDO55104_S430]